MKSKVKWLFLAGLLALLLISLLACTCTPPPPQPTMTNQQVAVTIAFSAVPSLDYYLKQEGLPVTNSTVQAVGEWVAVDEGGGNWKITGQVLVNYPEGDKYCSTTWTLKQDTGEIRLIQFKSD